MRMGTIKQVKNSKEHVKNAITKKRQSTEKPTGKNIF